MNAAVFVRPPAAEGEGGRARRNSDPRGNLSEFYRGVVLRQFQGVFWLSQIVDVLDAERGDPKYGFMKVEYRFYHLIPGAEKVQTVEEWLKFCKLGHGKMVTIKVNPICTAPFLKDDGDEGKPSAMYNLHRVLLARPKTMMDDMVLFELSKEQMGAASDDVVAAWQTEYNRASIAGDEATMAAMSHIGLEDFRKASELLTQPIKRLEDAKKRYAAAVLSETIQAIEIEHPQVYATPAQKKSKTTGNIYNTLQGLTGRVPTEAEIPGGWFVFRPRDPREDDDDPTLVCAICGQQTRGYLRNKDNTWVSNREAATTSIEKHGEVRCGRCWRKPPTTQA